MQRNHVELPEKDIKKNISLFYDLLKGFQHSVKKESSESGLRRTYTPGMNYASSNEYASQVKLIDTINAITPEFPLETNQQHLVITSLLRAMCIADAVTDIFGKQVGLKQLKDQNAAGALPANEVSRFNDMVAASSFIALQVTANYIVFKLGNSDQSTDVTPPSSIQYSLKNTLHAVKDVIYAFDQFLVEKARDDDSMISATKAFFNKLLDELAVQQGSINALSSVLGNEYFAASDDFAAIIGERSAAIKQNSFVMDFKKPEEVVGNAIAKFQAQKLAKMMMCYDFERQFNPFSEFGGSALACLGDGRPGTGKTTLIQMIAGLLKQYTEVAGYPFYYENLGVESVDSYQGKSAQNARAFIQNVTNPHVIGFGTIDDVDQVAASRGDKQGSAGKEEITAVLMSALAGTGTVVRGNALIALFSNYPEKVDDALRQRAGMRFLIDGPVTHEDFVDILALLLGDSHEIQVGDLELFATQQIQKFVDKSYEQHNLPQEPQLLEIYEQTIQRVGHLETLENIGYYLKAIQMADDRFTGRAVKNIVDAARMRSMDIDLPDEFFENPAHLLHQPYDIKRAMLLDFRKPITPTMLLQEINRYADSEMRYANTADEAEIEQQVRHYRITQEAQERFKQTIKQEITAQSKSFTLES